MWRALSCLLLAAVVGGCGFAGVNGRGVGSAQGPMGHQVQPGDSIQSIATRYDTTVEAVAAQNGIQPPYYLNVGQRLVIPQPDTYVVRQGDTLNDIARLHGVSPAELARINGIDAPYPVQVGQTLRFPQSTAMGAVPIGTAPSSPVQMATLPPPGATGGPVVGAAVPGSPIVAPAALPGAATGAPVPLVADPALPQGQGITQPLPAPQLATAALTPVGTAGAATDLPPAPQIAVPAPTTAPPTGADGLPTLSGSGFMRPVNGSVLTRFGEGSPVPNDGINIAAPAGTPILASEAGVVAYVGQNIDVFGNLVLVRHADGWVTAYGHAEAILVGEGDTVTRGQVIGRVGNTGSVTVPQLHFELRRGTEPVDPQAYLEG